MDAHAFLKDLFTRSLERMEPGGRTRGWLEREGIGPEDRPAWLLAAGKASPAMASAAAGWLGDRLRGGLVVFPGEGAHEAAERLPDTLERIAASHPLPDEMSLEAGRRAAELVSEIPEEGILLALISGGASSLLCLPRGGLGLRALRETHRQLLESGEDIARVNAVRKRLSEIKGGKLLERLHPGTRAVNLVVSDVPGDDPALVGSGPTIPAEGAAAPERCRTEVIASASRLARHAAELAGEADVRASVDEQAYSGRVEELVPRMAARVRESAEKGETELLIYYGESTVEVTGEGLGGRNQELALRAALEISGIEHAVWLSAGTDGIDGPTDAAGAVVDGTTVPRAREEGADPLDYLERNDSYRFHERMGTLLKTGPTGNNLMDLQLIWTGTRNSSE